MVGTSWNHRGKRGIYQKVQGSEVGKLSYEDLSTWEKIDLTRLNLKTSSSLIRTHNTDKRKLNQRSPYPNHSGYCVYVKRPVRDTLKWMNQVEEILDLLIEEIRDK